MDAILTGTILSDGEHLRVSTNWSRRPDGTVLWSNSSQVSLRDIFQLQDELVDRIVQSLTLPLTARERLALKHDVPAQRDGVRILPARQSACGRRGRRRRVQHEPGARPLSALRGPRSAVCAGVGLPGASAPLLRESCGIQRSQPRPCGRGVSEGLRAQPRLGAGAQFLYFSRDRFGAVTGRDGAPAETGTARRNDSNLFSGWFRPAVTAACWRLPLPLTIMRDRLDPHVRTSVAYTYLHLGHFQKVLEHCGSIDGEIKDTVVSGCGPRAGGDRTIARTGEDLPTTVGALVRHVAGLSGGRSRKELGSTRSSAGVCPDSYHGSRVLFFCSVPAGEIERDRTRARVGVRGSRPRIRLPLCLSCHPWLDSLRSHPRFKELANRAAVIGSPSPNRLPRQRR